MMLGKSQVEGPIERSLMRNSVEAIRFLKLVTVSSALEIVDTQAIHSQAVHYRRPISLLSVFVL